MSLRAEGEAICIDSSISRDCFVAALLAMTSGFNQMQIKPSFLTSPEPESIMALGYSKSPVLPWQLPSLSLYQVAGKGETGDGVPGFLIFESETESERKYQDCFRLPGL